MSSSRWVQLSLKLVKGLVFAALCQAGCVVYCQPAIADNGAPEIIRHAKDEEAKVRLPGEEVRAVYLTNEGIGSDIRADLSGALPVPADFQVWATKTLLDKDGELHAVFRVRRNEGDGNRIAIDKFIDVWHARTYDGGTHWATAKLIQSGWNGDIVGRMLQLPSGRLLVPSQVWVPGSSATPPTGNNFSCVLYSDDGGETWLQCESRITSPVYTGYNGNNYGAVEASVLPMKDDRLWMLMRTQTGFLYEAFSSDEGTTWSEAQPSRFRASTGPPFHFRLSDGRIVLFWNNCEMPSRYNGAGVYGGRDVLHAAISEDEGRTWHGFREVLRDPRRHQTPPSDGDRGTAYPYATELNDGTIELVAGQGQRFVVHVDPEWLYETEQACDFSDGLDGWSVYTAFGPASNWWRDRVVGPELDTKSQSLHLNRDNDRAADGAVWNFPAGDRGTMTLKVCFNEGFQGAEITLTDRFFDPTHDAAESEAVFMLAVSPVGHLSGGGSVLIDRWVELTLDWDVPAGRCAVTVGGKQVAVLPMKNEPMNGVSYLHVRSHADESLDLAGFDLGAAHVRVKP